MGRSSTGRYSILTQPLLHPLYCGAGKWTHSATLFPPVLARAPAPSSKRPHSRITTCLRRRCHRVHASRRCEGAQDHHALFDVVRERFTVDAPLDRPASKAALQPFTTERWTEAPRKFARWFDGDPFRIGYRPLALSVLPFLSQDRLDLSSSTLLLPCYHPRARPHRSRDPLLRATQTQAMTEKSIPSATGPRTTETLDSRVSITEIPQDDRTSVLVSAWFHPRAAARSLRTLRTLRSGSITTRFRDVRPEFPS